MTTGYISTYAPTALFTGTLPANWATYGFSRSGFGPTYTFSYRRTVTLNGVQYYSTPGWIYENGTNPNYTTPPTVAFSISQSLYVGTGSTEYFVKNAKQILITSSGANGEIKRKSGTSTYVSLPYTATYADGDTLSIVLKAFPATHYAWDPASSKWSDDDTNQERTLTVAASFAALADVAYTATYTQTEWLLTTVGSANGTAYIGASPSTITSAWYATAQSVSIRATATAAGYKFSKWTKGGADFSTSPTVSVTTEEADAIYTAVFIPISYTLNVTSVNSNQGTVAVKLGGSLQLTQTGLTVSSGIAYSDPVVQPVGVEVRATPLFGYSFTGWYLAGSLESSLANYSFSMPESNVSIEARFSVLETATLTVTKTKGNAGDTADAKDQGVVSLYHLESVLDLTSAAGTATLVASLYTTLQYKLVPTPASALYQFDGWYQTIEAVEVPITTAGIFVVDGNNLCVTAPNTTAIAVNAQFRKRALCTIAPVASDSSTYVNPNAAQTAGCTCAITNPAPDSTVEGDQWLSGQTITMEAVQAVGWELRQWLVKLSVSPYTVLVSKSKGDAGFGQTYTFNLTVNCQVIARSVYTLPADQMQIQALHKTGQDVASGTLEIHPCGDNYIEMTNGVMAQVDVDSVCELTAIPANGYKFVNWRITTISGTIVSTVPVYRFTVTASATYYAEFVATSEPSLLLFEGSDIAMLASWRGRINISNMPSNFSCARVYADGYPVAIDIGAAESPSSPLTALRVARSITNGQSPIRLPLRRPEKYSMIGFEANTVVNAISVATSMEGLKNG